MTIEDLLSETGGFGRFQLLILFGVGMNRFTIGWSMLQMSYVGMIPDWLCSNNNNASDTHNSSLNTCFLKNNASNQVEDGEACEKFHFVGPALTIINEWNLVCGLSWVKAAVTSIQMGGVLLGALVAGQLGDSLGRKKILYVFVLEHAVMNFVAAFSLTWEMFAVFRFFIGLGIGGVLVISFPYSLEFLPLKWRPLVSVLPIWTLGVCVFALASWLMVNWSYQHIACGVLSLTGLIGYIYIPESLRWLTVHAKMEEARDVVMKIAIINHKLQPRKASVSLQAIAWKEQKSHESNKTYTYIDMFREWTTTQTSLIFCFHWLAMAVTYFGLSFSVAEFAGSIYVNIFLLAVVEIPGILSTFYFNNKIGRKWTTIISLSGTCVPIFICLIVHTNGSGGLKTYVITGLCMVSKMALGAAWAVGETLCSEYYPTVTRCLGSGAVYAAASIGAAITPFIIDLNSAAVVSFSIMGCLLLIDIFMCLLTPETKDLDLEDTPNIISVSKRFAKDMYATSDNNEAVENSDNITDNQNNIEDGRVFKKNGWVGPEDDKETKSQAEQDEHGIHIVIGDEIDLDEDGWKTQHSTHKVKMDEYNATEKVDEESSIDISSTKPSPYPSPASSPKSKRFDKLKSGLFFNGKTSKATPKIKIDKAEISETAISESKVDKDKTTQSPCSSPTASPQIKRFDKLISGEFFQAIKSNSPKIKRPKLNIADVIVEESQAEKGLSTPSPNSSPAPSPRIKTPDRGKGGEFFFGKTSNDSPKTAKKDKLNMMEIRAGELQSEKGLQKPSPASSPDASPKIKRFDKIKSGEFFHGKSKPKAKDEAPPPYVESSRNKNVRFSIY